MFACTSDVCLCVRALLRCVCARALQMCVCAKLLTQRSTVTPTIPSVFYARLVPSSSPYVES